MQMRICDITLAMASQGVFSECGKKNIHLDGEYAVACL